MHRKKRIAGLLSALLLAAVVTGCSSTGSDTPTTTSTTEIIASYDQGDVSQDALYEKLLSNSGMTIMLEMVDKGILDVIEPITDEMKTTADENLASLKEYYGDDLLNALEANGFKDVETYKDMLFLNLQRNAYIMNYVQTEMLTDEEVQTYYDSYEPEIEASHILISPEGDSEAEWAKALETAKALVGRYEAGEDFAELAIANSADTGSGMAGGVLGSFGKGKMVPEFEQAAFALEVGAHTAEPVKTQFGYHIILKTAGEKKAELEAVRDNIVKQLSEEKLKADEGIGFKALVKMREDNGFNIDNTTLNDQYNNFSSQITGEKSE